MNRFPLGVVLMCVSSMLWSGCNTDVESFDPIEQLNTEVAAIDRYLEANNLVALKHISGIRLVIDTLGSGLPISIYSDPEIEVEYEGRLFDANKNSQIFAPKAVAENEPASRYITGWQIALAILPEGSKARVFIPSFFAYGTTATAQVPPNSTLIFDLHFQEIVDRPIASSQYKTDTTAVKKFLKDNQINATYDSMGIWYTITDSADGIQPTWYDKVKLKYSLYALPDTTTILGEDELTAEPNSNTDSRVVDFFHGMQIGLQRMTEGSKATLYVPSSLGFAGQEIADDDGGIAVGKNTNLMVKVELVEVIK